MKAEWEEICCHSARLYISSIRYGTFFKCKHLLSTLRNAHFDFKWSATTKNKNTLSAQCVNTRWHLWLQISQDSVVRWKESAPLAAALSGGRLSLQVGHVSGLLSCDFACNWGGHVPDDQLHNVAPEVWTYTRHLVLK